MRVLGIALLCSIVLSISSVALGDSYQLINDRRFAQGFSVLAPSHPPTIEGVIQSDPLAGPPAWELAQWSSQSTIFGSTPNVLPSGAYEFSNPDKTIVFGGGTSASEADLTLGVNSISEYGGGYRVDGQIWPHLIAQQGVSGPGGHLYQQAPSIGEMTSLDLHLDVKLLKDDRLTDVSQGYNPNMHASQFGTIFTIQNLNSSSPGFGDFVWFGLSIYDDREDVTTLYVQADAFSPNLIYSLGMDVVNNPSSPAEYVNSGNWIAVEEDLLPHVETALQTAWNTGYLPDSQNMSDYYVGGAIVSWELPGTSDAAMQIRNLSLVGRTNNDVPSGHVDDASTKGLWHMDNVLPNGSGVPYFSDDNSGGFRPAANELLLGKAVGGPYTASAVPTVVNDGHDSVSSALRFDGVDDEASVESLWTGEINRVAVNLFARPEALPTALNDDTGPNDNFDAILGTWPWRLYWQDDGSGVTGRFLLTVTNAADDAFSAVLPSQPGLALDAWHEVEILVTEEGHARLAVDGHFETTELQGGFSTTASQAIFGRDVNGLNRFFTGSLDEVRIALDPLVSLTPGDFDLDGDVDGADFLVWQRGFGTHYDSDDLADWTTNYGSAASPAVAATPLPEPSTMLLSFVGLFFPLRSQAKDRNK